MIIQQTPKDKIVKHFGCNVLTIKGKGFDICFSNVPEINGHRRIYFKGATERMVADENMSDAAFENLLSNIDITLEQHGFIRIQNNKMKEGEFYYEKRI